MTARYFDLHYQPDEYLCMLHTGSQHPRSRFLLLIQALEGLYGYETRETYESRVERHQLSRKVVLASISNTHTRRMQRFVKACLAKVPPNNLDSALYASFLVCL
jgi:hypothetical protein